MRVLALDTCLGACSAAVWDTATGTLHARYEFMRQGHAERLCPMIDEVVVTAGAALRALDAIAVTIGPGTFTGVRLGLAAARGFALATGATLLGATSLSLLAATARAHLPELDLRPIAACIPGRKGEVMVEIVGVEVAAQLGDARLLPLADAVALIAAEAPEAVLVGSAARTVAEAAATVGIRFDAALPGVEPEARYLSHLALVQLPAASPLYLRPPDATPQLDISLSRAP